MSLYGGLGGCGLIHPLALFPFRGPLMTQIVSPALELLFDEAGRFSPLRFIEFFFLVFSSIRSQVRYLLIDHVHQRRPNKRPLGKRVRGEVRRIETAVIAVLEKFDEVASM